MLDLYLEVVASTVHSSGDNSFPNRPYHHDESDAVCYESRAEEEKSAKYKYRSFEEVTAYLASCDAGLKFSEDVAAFPSDQFGSYKPC